MQIGSQDKGKGKKAPTPAAEKTTTAAPVAGKSLMDIAKEINKHDPGSMLAITQISLVPRASTGVFPIDYQTGGGWLRGRINIVWAKEGAGKSLLVYLTIAADQIINPTKKQVIIDIEGRIDREWVTSLMPKPENLMILQPITVEEAIDKAEAVIMATDVSIMAFDSVAMLITENELNSAAEKAAVGGSSSSVGKLMRKMTARLNDLKRLNRHPAIILVNQVRQKIGVMYGNPDGQPGGNAPRFMSSLTLWLHSKNEKSKDSEIVQWKATECTLHKWTTKILAEKSAYHVCVSQVVDKSTGEIQYYPGEIYDWPLVKRELERLGLLRKAEKGGYEIITYKEPKQFRVLTDIEAYYTDRANKLEYLTLKKQLINVALAGTHGIAAQEEN